MTKQSDEVLIRVGPGHRMQVEPTLGPTLWTQTIDIGGQLARVALGDDATIYLTCLQGSMKLLSYRLRPYKPRVKRYLTTVELPEADQVTLAVDGTLAVSRTDKPLIPQKLIGYIALEVDSGKHYIIVVNDQLTLLGLSPAWVFD